MSRAQFCSLFVILCVVALGRASRLVEQSIDLLPRTEGLVEGAQEPRHLSGYFTVRLA